MDLKIPIPFLTTNIPPMIGSAIGNVFVRTSVIDVPIDVNCVVKAVTISSIIFPFPAFTPD